MLVDYIEETGVDAQTPPLRHLKQPQHKFGTVQHGW